MQKKLILFSFLFSSMGLFAQSPTENKTQPTPAPQVAPPSAQRSLVSEGYQKEKEIINFEMNVKRLHEVMEKQDVQTIAQAQVTVMTALRERAAAAAAQLEIARNNTPKENVAPKTNEDRVAMARSKRDARNYERIATRMNEIVNEFASFSFTDKAEKAVTDAKFSLLDEFSNLMRQQLNNEMARKSAENAEKTPATPPAGNN